VEAVGGDREAGRVGRRLPVVVEPGLIDAEAAREGASRSGGRGSGRRRRGGRGGRCRVCRRRGRPDDAARRCRRFPCSPPRPRGGLALAACCRNGGGLGLLDLCRGGLGSGVGLGRPGTLARPLRRSSCCGCRGGCGRSCLVGDPRRGNRGRSCLCRGRRGLLLRSCRPPCCLRLPERLTLQLAGRLCSLPRGPLFGGLALMVPAPRGGGQFGPFRGVRVPTVRRDARTRVSRGCHLASTSGAVCGTIRPFCGAQAARAAGRAYVPSTRLPRSPSARLTPGWGTQPADEASSGARWQHPSERSRERTACLGRRRTCLPPCLLCPRADARRRTVRQAAAMSVYANRHPADVPLLAARWPRP